MREHVGCARTRREATHPIDLHMVLVTYRWPAHNTRASGRPRAAAPFRGAAGRGPNPGRRSGRRAVDSSRSREDMREDCSRRIRYRSLGEVTNYRMYYRAVRWRQSGCVLAGYRVALPCCVYTPLSWPLCVDRDRASRWRVSTIVSTARPRAPPRARSPLAPLRTTHTPCRVRGLALGSSSADRCDLPAVHST